MKTLVNESGSAIDWLMTHFNLDLSLVSFMGGHSNPRCHRGNSKVFPGMMITYAQMEAFDKICEESKG